MTPTLKITYTLPEAAQALGLSISMVRKAIRTKRLVACKAGARVLVRHADLQAYADSLPVVEPKSRVA